VTKDLDIYFLGEEISDAEEKELFDIAVALQKAAIEKAAATKNKKL
jgi:hypothetical protein